MRYSNIIKLKIYRGIKGVKREKSRFYATWPLVLVAYCTLYANLREYQGWRRGSAVSNDAWNRYQDALQSELHMWYGAENDLTAWHALCRAIGVKPLPKTCEQCEQVGDHATKFGRFMLTRII